MEFKDFAFLCKALSDETRIRIMNLLKDEGELCVCNIVTTLGVPQSTASRHLSYLKKAGFVKDRRRGQWIHYSINDENKAASDIIGCFPKFTAPRSGKSKLKIRKEVC